MKIKHILFTCLFLITCAAVKSQTPASTDSAADDRGYIVKVGDEAPADFELVLSNGTKTSLKDLRGKVVNCNLRQVGAAFAVRKCRILKKIFGKLIKIKAWY